MGKRRDAGRAASGAGFYDRTRPGPLALALENAELRRANDLEGGLSFLGGVSAATRNCPTTATKPSVGGHVNCPLTVMGSARHDVVCLTALRG